MKTLVGLLLLSLAAVAADRPNILFIAADDLRVEPLALTPNLDRLASRSRVFANAHCQQAVCNPSRSSILTGLRPDTLGIWNLESHFRSTRPDLVTLPQHFKQHGYFTRNIGKIYHNFHHSIEGDPVSWSLPARFHWGNHGDDKPQFPGTLPPNLASDPKCECRDVPDSAYIDGRIAAAAVKALRDASRQDQPFFLAVGFWKPHAPFNAPKKYWDLYDRDAIPLPDPAGWPEGAPRIAAHASREILGWGKMPRTLTPEAVRELRHGYLANTSYLDAQLGKLLDELDRLDLRKNTLVVFWSDHGYHLDEHTLWAKTSNFELDARVPLLISTPDLTDPGEQVAAPVELLDLYPTLNDLCRLPPVPGLEGVSLRPLLVNPAGSVKTAALTQHPRPAYIGRKSPDAMGYSARTLTHRYTEWRDWSSGNAIDRELYKHTTDPGETRNLARLPAMKPLLLRLAALLPAAVTHPAEAADKAAPPPGVVIHHSPASTGHYIGSPSLCILPNGDYLASHDLFGPKSTEHQQAKGRLYRSTDKGESWSHLADMDGWFWTGLFVHRGDVHALGTDKHHGNLVIRRSADHGKSWTGPVTIEPGQWHTAPMPVIEHGGRLWRAVEDAHTAEKWGERYRARMISAPAGADLLDPKSWTLSNALARDTEWLGGTFEAWLEGNAVVTPDGRIIDMLRVQTPGLPEKAAIVRISKDGTAASFDPERDFVDFPGGAKKFTVRKDPAGPGYWSLTNIIPERHVGEDVPGGLRNTLALVYSDDLRTWETRCVLIYHPGTVKHGFQYPDWQFDGDDLVAVVRTAFDDEHGGAHRAHDANYLTFHRWENFRQLTRDDDVPMPEFIAKAHETDALAIKGSGFEIATLEEGATAFSNRSYRWGEVPEELAGKSFTRLAGGESAILEATAKEDTTLVIATATDQGKIDLTGWQRAAGSFCYDDTGKTRMHVFTRELRSGETLRLPRGNWTGSSLIFANSGKQ